MAEEQPQRVWTKGFVLMWAGQFLVSMNFYLLMTVMALYAMERFGTDESSAGVATSTFIVGAVVARLLTGKYMEIVGRRRVLLAALVLLTLCSAAYLLDTGFAGLLVVRVLNGVAFGMSTTVLPAAVQALIPPGRRGEGTGYFMLSTTLAAALGPLVGLTLSTAAGYPVLFWTCTGVAAAGALLGVVTRVPELTLSAEQRRGLRSFAPSQFVEARALPVAALMLFVGTGYASILSFINPFAVQEDLVGPAGAYFLAYAATILVSRPFAGRLQDRRGDNAVLYPALVLFAVALLLLAAADSAAVMLASGTVLGVGYGAVLSAAQAAAVRSAPLTRVGLATSTFFLSMDVGVALGPVLLGALVPALGYRGMYVAAAGVVVLGLVYYAAVPARRGGRPAAGGA
ncbi:MFS transporter [Kocuria dechangensis]|jgi:MFS family permease|uniref:MFS transporter n=1 Tax=Kocuria dechangensis TaxID=1176249 RepID=A0A917LVA0_9MICC|nr:MFS transporter [Kocuria dechangensis]GGG59713.1 MFS transporter [Kocuria dechangensis]